jgi:predicted acyl esterase
MVGAYPRFQLFFRAFVIGSCCSSIAAAQAIHDTNVAIPMRDSVLLRADVWRPAGDGKFPVLVYRTPYGKQAAEDDYTRSPRRWTGGTRSVIQDVRGRYASAGEFNPYRNEGQDGTTPSSGQRPSRGRTGGSAPSGSPIPARCSGWPR